MVDDALFLKGKSSLAALSAHPNIEIRVFNPCKRVPGTDFGEGSCGDTRIPGSLERRMS